MNQQNIILLTPICKLIQNIIAIIMMSVTGPGLWVVSQLLLLVYFKLDNGANTCGIDFHFENKAAKKRDLDSIVSEDAPREETYCEFKILEELCIRKFSVSEKGRLNHDNH